MLPVYASVFLNDRFIFMQVDLKRFQISIPENLEGQYEIHQNCKEYKGKKKKLLTFYFFDQKPGETDCDYDQYSDKC